MVSHIKGVSFKDMLNARTISATRGNQDFDVKELILVSSTNVLTAVLLSIHVPLYFKDLFTHRLFKYSDMLNNYIGIWQGLDDSLQTARKSIDTGAAFKQMTSEMIISSNLFSSSSLLKFKTGNEIWKSILQHIKTIKQTSSLKRTRCSVVFVCIVT